MSDYIKLPKSILTSALWTEENFARYFVYLLSKTNDDGLIMASQYQTAIDLALSRQKIRTLQKRAEEEGLIIAQNENKLRDLSTHKSTHKSTQKITTLRLNNQRTYKNSQPTNQPTNQPTKQPRKSKQIEEIVTNFKDGSFVFTYYRFVDKFHVEPKSWSDLFEFLHYNETEAKIDKLVQFTLKEGGK